MANISRDERIKRDNPTLSAYELLTQKQISQEFYNKLVADNYQPVKATDEAINNAIANSQPTQPAVQPERITPPTPQPIKPVVTRANPKTNRPAQVMRGKSDMAYLVNNTTKKRTRMTRASANFMAKLDKNFSVI